MAMSQAQRDKIGRAVKAAWKAKSAKVREGRKAQHAKRKGGKRREMFIPDAMPARMTGNFRLNADDKRSAWGGAITTRILDVEVKAGSAMALTMGDLRVNIRAVQ